MDKAPDIMLAAGIASVTAGAFVTLGLGAALVTAGVGLIVVALLASKAGL